MSNEEEVSTLDLGVAYTPHPGQKWLHDQDAHVKVLEVGRRWGKSRFALWELIRRFVESLEIEVDNSIVPPFHAWIVAPSFPQSRQVWNELISFMPQQFVAPGGIHQDDRLIYLVGSQKRQWGLLEVKSAHDPDALQTAGLDFLWITESQDVSDRAFEKLLPTLRSPGRMSYGVFEGIPSLWRDHWFHRTFESAQGGRPGFIAYKATSFENPLLDDAARAEIEADRESLREMAWRRMYLAEFSEEAGYFRNVSNCIAGDLQSDPLPGVEYVAGLDLGRKMDASVMHIMDAKNRSMVAHYMWDDGTNWVMQREAITRIAKEWDVTRLVIDATGMGGDIFVQEIQEAGLPVEPFIITAASREHILQALGVSMERQTIHFPAVPSLLRQLRAFQYRKMPGGRYRVEAPPGEHDDEVFALALALTACAEAPTLDASPPRRFRNRRYVPTQAEAASGGFASKGQRLMRERMLQRMAERIEESGVN